MRIALCAVLACACVDVDVEHASSELPAADFNELNATAGTAVLYEVQARTANACHPGLGAWWQRVSCAAKPAPAIEYRAEGAWCGELEWLESIRLGTLDDLRVDTADYRAGITLRYIDERVGANTVWLMPVFPNNDRWNLPDGCDNLGSPYAVRDYLHVRGTLDEACIERGRDEYSAEPCWGNGALDAVIAQAHDRGMKVILDVAFNHFGHNYLLYDYAGFRAVRDRIADGEDLAALWSFPVTQDDALLYPALLDTPEALEAAADPGALAALRARCPGLDGDALVRAYGAWRIALDWERDQFPCEPAYLEYQAPGFYLAADAWSPSSGVGDNFTSQWNDVKFLYHEEGNWHAHELARNREYLFRVLNYWVSRGVDGFRLDHTTDDGSGLGPNEWDYIISKVDYYAWLRGQDRPLWLAEEFHDQQGMSRVVDIMTEGYLRDMTGRGGVTKDTGHVEWVVANRDRFGGHTYVMTALETHDELRLVSDAGFTPWTGAGFWGIGATTWSTPMLLMGQEFGEPHRLAFRKSDLLRGRFEDMAEYRADGDALIAFYRQMIDSRLAHENRALVAPWYALLRSRWTGEADARIFAQLKWSDDRNVVFTFHNLWEQHVAQSFFIPPEVAAAAGIQPGHRYRLRDVMSGGEKGACRTGAELGWNLYVEMPAHIRLQWLRLESCDMASQ